MNETRYQKQVRIYRTSPAQAYSLYLIDPNGRNASFAAFAQSMEAAIELEDNRAEREAAYSEIIAQSG